MRFKTSTGNFRAQFSALLQPRVAELVEEYRFVEISANRPPWTAVGIKLAEGDRVTLFCAGRAWLTAMPEAWVDAHFGLWIRVGTRAPIFRVPRGSLTFAAPDAGELYLTNLFPAGWADENGALASSPGAFEKVAGAFEVLIIRWRSDPVLGLQRMAEPGGVAAELVADELRAWQDPVTPPPGWKYLWSTGDAEAFRADADGGIRCDIVDDGTILQKPVSAPFTPSTRLRWSWKVDQLPSSRAEDSVASHDYLSIAVEFDNGKDLTYFWSIAIEPEHSFACPIPSWRNRETHMAIRSGSGQLGQWIGEERDLWRDYQRAVGSQPSRIVAVWLIAVSIFQHGVGRCAYRNIELLNGSEKVSV